MVVGKGSDGGFFKSHFAACRFFSARAAAFKYRDRVAFPGAGPGELAVKQELKGEIKV